MTMQNIIAAIASAYKTHAAAIAAANAARKTAVDPLFEKLAAEVEAKRLDRAAMRSIVYPVFAEVYGAAVKTASRGPKAGQVAFVETDCAARKAADRALDRLFPFAISFSFSEKEIAAMDALIAGVLKLKAKNADGESVAVGRKALMRLLNERYDAAEGK